jgi:uncharacterized protein
MNELREQLEALRERVARVQARMAEKHAPQENFSAVAPKLARNPFEQGVDQNFVSDFDPDFDAPLPGQQVTTEHGTHWEMVTHYPAHHIHGSADVGALADLPQDLLHAVSSGEAPATHPFTWAFLDTETTGLAGGTGTCAFLVGVGRISPEGFTVRQFFMRDYEDEPSLLYALAEHLAEFQVLITYNGRTYDQPLLETRYRLNRTRPPFARLAHHVDLLYGSRRLWKLRYESCRLVDLETQVLGYERQGDVPGSLIPYLYFDYLRTRQATRLRPVFTHNTLDILTLACLTGIVPTAFKDVDTVQHGAELAGLGRWTLKNGDVAESRDLLQRAVDAGLPDQHLFRTLWDIAALDRKLGHDDRAVALWTDLANSPNPYRLRALEELAKFAEHRLKDYAQALQWTETALVLEITESLLRRQTRLRKRQAKH